MGVSSCFPFNAGSPSRKARFGVSTGKHMFKIGLIPLTNLKHSRKRQEKKNYTVRRLAGAEAAGPPQRCTHGADSESDTNHVHLCNIKNDRVHVPNHKLHVHGSALTAATQAVSVNYPSWANGSCK